MSFIAFHISFKKFAPAQLLKIVRQVEQAGFDAIHVSDPSENDQREFSFSWLGAAMHASKIPFTVACTPNLRYGLPNIAREMATIGDLFPGRFDLALSRTDEFEAEEKKQQVNIPAIEETASFIRRVLSGEKISYDDGRIQDRVKVHSLPKIPALLFFETSSIEEAGRSAEWADGIIIDADDTNVAYDAIEKFRNKGGNNKAFSVRLTFSYGKDPSSAIESAVMDNSKFIPPQRAADKVQPEAKEENRGKFKVLTSIADLLQWIEHFRKLEASRLILKNVNENQELFINDYAQFHKSYKTVATVD